MDFLFKRDGHEITTEELLVIIKKNLEDNKKIMSKNRRFSGIAM
jgi:hypothetical protein